jgi:AcrR family transcriptional regulator
MPDNKQPLLKRPERRQAIVDAATRAFARTGFAASNMADIAADAVVSRVFIYRHFESKEQLYQAALDQVADQLMAATGGPDNLGPNSLAGLVDVAAGNPDGFRLFFRQAGAEPEFRQHADWLRQAMTDTARPYLETQLPDEAKRRWAASLVPVAGIEALIAWLDAGAPDRDRASETVAAVVGGVINAIAGGDQ